MVVVGSLARGTRRCLYAVNKWHLGGQNGVSMVHRLVSTYSTYSSSPRNAASNSIDQDLKEAIDGRAKLVSSSSESTGLLGEPRLQRPEDFLSLAAETKGMAESLAKSIGEAPARGPAELRKVVRNLDRLSDALCKVIDLAEFVRTAHPDGRWSDAAEHAHQYLCSYMNVLNTDTSMYKSLQLLLKEDEIAGHLGEEERHVAKVFLADFEKSAIHLPSRQRERFVSISDEILALSTAFSHNLSVEEGRPSASVPLDWLKDAPQDLLRSILNAREVHRQGNMLSIPAESRSLLQIIRYAPDERAREVAYRSAYASGERQCQILEALLLKRAQLAALTEHETFAHLTLKDKLAKSPENVIRFLETRLAELRPDVLKQEKQLMLHHAKQSSRMNAWDRDFLMNNYLTTAPTSVDTLSTFLSVGTVFSGLSRLFSLLFGIQLRPVQTSPGETWTEDVLKLEVIDEDAGGRVGVVYADLWSRPGKPMGAAHFTVRCSRRVDLDDDFSRAGVSPLTGEVVHTKDREGLYQQPVVALLCDFRKPNRDGATLLQWPEVETLVHEMGHALHSMVGRTEFQNVSGTRCATDFVELPSILLEKFLYHHESLAMIARHHITGRPLALDELLAQLSPSSKFAHLEAHDELMLAFLDQHLHSVSPATAYLDTTKEYEKVQLRASILRPTLNLDWQGRFSHLISYPATYYAYPLDRALADAVWSDTFADPSLSSERGRAYKHQLLSFGGSREPSSLIAAYVDRLFG